MSDPSLFDEEPQKPVRPYRQDGRPSSGWSGSDTSKDAEPIRAGRQRDVWNVVEKSGMKGSTWFDVGERLGLHHGKVSGPLAVLHQRGHLARLTETRGRSKVYVLPSLVQGRDTEQPKTNRSRKDLARAAFFAGAYADPDGSIRAAEIEKSFDAWWETQ